MKERIGKTVEEMSPSEPQPETRQFRPSSDGGRDVAAKLSSCAMSMPSMARVRNREMDNCAPLRACLHDSHAGTGHTSPPKTGFSPELRLPASYKGTSYPRSCFDSPRHLPYCVARNIMPRSKAASRVSASTRSTPQSHRISKASSSSQRISNTSSSKPTSYRRQSALTARTCHSTTKSPSSSSTTKSSTTKSSTSKPHISEYYKQPHFQTSCACS